MTINTSNTRGNEVEEFSRKNNEIRNEKTETNKNMKIQMIYLRFDQDNLHPHWMIKSPFHYHL